MHDVNKIKILHIVPSFYPAFYYGGPIHSLYGLCNALARNDIELRVLTTDTAGMEKRITTNKFPTRYDAGYLVYFCKRIFGVSIAPGLLYHMTHLMRWADIVHLTAVYSFPTIPALLLCKKLNKPVVWSPRGAFQRWEKSRRPGLKSVWELVCRAIGPKHLILHVTSEEEAKESINRISCTEVAVIANGIDIPDRLEHTDRGDLLRILFLGRLDPIKGIENLLEACKMINKNSKLSWSLTIAGIGALRYTEAIKSHIKKLGLSRQVKMVGEVKGEDKKMLFENADLSIVPSYKENFGMVVAESLANGVPVIASKGTPWSRIEEIGCGLWVDNDPHSLTCAIEKAKQMPLREMGQRGRTWMQNEFLWDKIAKKMANTYLTLLRG